MALAFLPTAASASQSGLTGLPWVDQYIEQVPTAGGGKVVRDVTGKQRTGLTRSQVSALADAGGDRMAAAISASVLPVAGRGSGSGPASRSGTTPAASIRRQAESVDLPSTSATLIDSASGSNGGLGPVLPAALLGSLIGAVALGASRIRRIGS